MLTDLFVIYVLPIDNLYVLSVVEKDIVVSTLWWCITSQVEENAYLCQDVKMFVAVDSYFDKDFRFSGSVH